MATRCAYSLMIGDAVYIKQVDGARVTLKTPATIKGKWEHGPLVTILTSRGYVELDELDLVEVA